MNILFLTLLDYSTIYESGIYTDLMREFVKNNHRVYIISPSEKRKKEKTRLLDFGDAKILKLQIGNIQKTNFIEKGISTITLESQYQAGIKKYFSDIKFDLVIYTTPPITLKKAVEFVKKRDNAKTYLLLKDIFPQNSVDLGLMKKKGPLSGLYKIFRHKEKQLYKLSDYIGCMSQANVDYLLKKNPDLNSSKSIEVCPNSIEPQSIEVSDSDRDKIREKYQVPKDKFIFIYGGNLGKPQGIDFLIECIKENERNDNSFILVVGSGTEFSKINRFFEEARPQNAKLMAHMPREDYEVLANTCDVGLIFLDKRFTIPNFPSRLLSYMQASMPILAATDVNTDIGDTIMGGNFGYWCESDNAIEFNQLMNNMCDEKLLLELGKNSRKYLENNYTSNHSYKSIMKHFI